MFRVRALFTMIALLAVGLACATSAFAAPKPRQEPTSTASGGAEYGAIVPADQLTVPGSVAKVVKGIAYAPADAPDEVKQMIWATNKIIGKPYIYGGGHSDFVDKGYDCSGTVSFALHGADLLSAPRDSSDFLTYGAGGRGAWITIYTRSDHAYLTVAGIRLDTSAADDPGGKSGPRWRPLRQSNRNFKARHPADL